MFRKGKPIFFEVESLEGGSFFEKKTFPKCETFKKGKLSKNRNLSKNESS